MIYIGITHRLLVKQDNEHKTQNVTKFDKAYNGNNFTLSSIRTRSNVSHEWDDGVFTTSNVDKGGRLKVINSKLSTFSVYIIYGQRVTAPSSSILCHYALTEVMRCIRENKRFVIIQRDFYFLMVPVRVFHKCERMWHTWTEDNN